MNYLRQYELLILKAKNRDAITGYFERHHIIPRCVGGSDVKENIVCLTAKEHYVAHHLLYLYYKTPALAFAWGSMTRKSRNQKRVFTSRMFAKARSAVATAQRKRMRLTENNPMNNLSEEGKVRYNKSSRFSGKQHSEATKQLIAKSTKIRAQTNWKRPEVRKKYLESFTPERRKKLSENCKQGKFGSFGQPGPRMKLPCSNCGKVMDYCNLVRHGHTVGKCIRVTEPAACAS